MKLNCHCGAVEIEVNLKDGLTNLKRCNCSMCKRKGAIIKNINKEDLKIIKGEDKLNVYQFKTKVLNIIFVTRVVFTLIILEELTQIPMELMLLV